MLLPASSARVRSSVYYLFAAFFCAPSGWLAGQASYATGFSALANWFLFALTASIRNGIVFRYHAFFASLILLLFSFSSIVHSAWRWHSSHGINPADGIAKIWPVLLAIMAACVCLPIISWLISRFARDSLALARKRGVDKPFGS